MPKNPRAAALRKRNTDWDANDAQLIAGAIDELTHWRQWMTVLRTYEAALTQIEEEERRGHD